MKVIRSKDGKSELRLTDRKVLGRFPERYVEKKRIPRKPAKPSTKTSIKK